MVRGPCLFLVALVLAHWTQSARDATDCSQCLSQCGAALCSTGEFLTGNNCTVCPAGYKCPAPGLQPEACSSGQYSGNGSTLCVTCPSGHSCLDPTQSPVVCPAGTFSLAGAAHCTACSEGSYSVSGQSSCLECPAGHFCRNGSSFVTPTPCVGGEHSPAGVDTCSQCPGGTYSDNGSEGCISCPPGHYCPLGSPSPLSCPVGSWSPGKTASCDLCPAGYGCGSTEPTPCQPGEWSPLGNNTCLLCPAGASCVDPTLPPVLCELGYHSAEGESHCRLCPAGYACSAQGLQSLCTDGHFSLLGQSDCTACPIGHSCPLPFLSPILCARGQHTNGSMAAVTCSECPAGYYCSSLSLPPMLCPNGTFSYSDSTSCSICPSGYQCPTTQAPPIPCMDGYQSSERSTQCTPCPTGYGCPLASDPSLDYPCSPGQYSIEGSAVCQSCPAGSGCPNTSQSIVCETGTFSLEGYTVCEPCPAGWACPYIDGHGNTPCSPGTFSAGNATSCTLCPAGFACPITTLDIPVPCSQGSFAEEGQTNCDPCPAGFSCPLTTAPPTDICAVGSYSDIGMAECVPCAAGWACPSTITSNDIITCVAGTYSLDMFTQCKTCPAGSYCPNTTISPLPCPAGQYSIQGSIECTSCPSGFSCLQPDSLPVICDIGTFSTGQSTACLSCQPGYFCAEGSTSGNHSSSLCALGYYCPDGGTQLPCLAGTYGNRTGLTDASECLVCPAGFYCAEGTPGYPTSSLRCPLGHYCPAGTTTQFESPCPDGTYSTTFGLERADQCLNCPAGRHCSGGDAIGGQICPRGHFCAGNSSTPTPCPGGSYTEATGSDELVQCEQCPAGFYCESGTDSPTPCPAGSYNPLLGQDQSIDCLACIAGMACTTTALTQPNELCSAGHFCPEGSDRAGDPLNACPAGTFTDYHNLTTADECSRCPAGWACPSGTGGVSSPRLACALGHFCPNGTQFTTQYQCAAGSYGNKTTLQRQSECEICPPGYYCAGGESSPTGPCDPGHYCPLGTRSATEFACPAGMFFDQTGNVRIQNCLQCTAGNYCPIRSVLPKPCSKGTFSDTLGAPDVSTCSSCPGGYHCPSSATITPTPCQIGFFSDNGAANCTICSPGYYCDNVTTSLVDLHTNKICPAGLSCASEGHTNPPNLLLNACPSGHYCLQGDLDAFPIPCPNGTYTPLTGRKTVDQCTPCPPGKFCSPEGRSQPTGECALGHYCPLGTRFEDEFPCPISTFLANASAESLESCTTCISGFYCPIAGLGNPVVCPRGFYCVTGSNQPQPCPPGTYGNSTGLRRSQECLPCPGGQYCDGFGLPNPTGLCDAGFFCRSRAEVAAPVDGITGGICPRGGFCPQGSAIQANCPVGTYGNSMGNRAPSDCITCDPGFFCSGDNNPSPTGMCDEGCFCPGGANDSCQFATPPGSFSAFGQAAPSPCQRGTYQQASRQSSCISCLPGLFCNETGLVLGSTCPQGSYCPAGSTVPMPCPRGTYSNTEGLFNVTSCLLCTPGYYCDNEGLTTPTAQCDPGHYCLAGAELPNPGFNGELYGDICPTGHYCLAGTGSPTQFQCPPGTFNPTTGGSSIDNCLPCTGGYVCSEYALAAPNEGCSPGHYCAQNATYATPVAESWGDLCFAGHFCSGNTSQPIICPNGFFSNSSSAIECTRCPSGSYCVNGSFVLGCPPGYFCPEGTGLDWMPCSIGSYNPFVSARSLNDCLPCPGGRFCASTAVSLFDGIVAGDCSAGYYCLEGVDSPTPQLSSTTGIGGECPRGFYCPASTHTPVPCPPGTFSNSLLLQNVSECQTCSPGMYCDGNNLTAPTGDCTGGFVCIEGAIFPNPAGNDSSGYPCPVGHYCPSGSSIPLLCNPGEFNPLEAQAVCFNCPPGYYCLEGLTDFNSTSCLAGYYCPEGTTHMFEFPCPPGTYRASEGAQALADCTLCDPGHYCTGGLSSPDGFCDSGWYCSGGASSPQPLGISASIDIFNISKECNASSGSQCTPGFYCPVGSAIPLPCPAGMYCDGFNLSFPTGECFPGYYCLSGASSPAPDDGISGFPCPEGHYCSQGVIVPSPCPVGTYLNATGSDNVTDCVPCTGGSYCASEGLAIPTGLCSPGYYCPEGSTVGNDSTYICTPGHQCPEGSPVELICLGGTYQPDSGMPNCITCPERSYCPFNVSSPLTEFFDCPVGHYCPNGTSGPTDFACPRGTFNSMSNRASLQECTPCSGGKYCGEEGLATSNGSGPCLAGFFCFSGAEFPNPRDGVTGDECPSGYYCPDGTTEPIACPIGTFSPGNGSVSLSDCLDCTPGQYCNMSGLSEPTGACEPGYFCVGASTTPVPVDGMTGNVCELGHFCPGGSNLSLPCPPGTFSNVSLAINCSVCPAGFYCIDTLDPMPCPRGYYCPLGTGFDLMSCPPGTFSNNDGLSGVDECSQCTGGSFCDTAASLSVTGSCEAGFFCTMGSNSATPDGTNTGVAGPCPMGHYCPAGSTIPFQCPPGSFSKTTHLTNLSQCLPCTPGYFCEEYGLDAPTGLCSPGYYCGLGSSTSTPLTNDSTGGVCPAAHFCPSGSPMPIECSPGSYNPDIGRESCLLCPAGSFCPGNSTQVDFTCLAGHYCPEGSAFPEPCLEGTFNPLLGSRNDSDCSACPPGMFCSQSGLAWPSGPCSEGYYCTSGSPSSTPSSAVHGGRCEAGFFCPNGSSSPQSCPPGSYCSSSGLSEATGPCSAGYYCIQGATIPTPTDTVTGNLCECGHYCLQGTTNPQPCSAGFYLDLIGGTAPSDCIPCDMGSYCVSEGLCSPSGPCAAGYYCPTGQNSSQPSDYACLVGHFCPEGSSDPVPCTAGLYQNVSGQASCLDCPPGHYCEQGTVQPVVCPPGTQRNASNGAIESDCQLCTAGYYCPVRECADLSGDVFQNCSNLFCTLNVTGDSNIHGIPCSAGTYCPLGSPIPILCPSGATCQPRATAPTPCTAGFYCSPGSDMEVLCVHPFYCPPSTGDPLLCPGGLLARDVSTRTDSLRTSVDDSCFACQPGFYSDDGIACYECPAGYYCSGSISNPFNFPCPTGSYCPLGSASPVPCPPGTYRTLPLAQNVSDCLICPGSTFNNLEGQMACRPCGSSSVPTEDRTICTCIGAQRSFSPSTGACVCDSGYSFFNEAGQEDPDSDDIIDCQPIVDERCSTTQGRLASSRSCADPLYSCQDECAFQGGSGSLNIALGVCDCNNLVDPLALCTGECLVCRPELLVRNTLNSTLLLSVRDCNGLTLMEIELSGVFGLNSLGRSDSRTQVITHSVDGEVLGALYTTNDAALDIFSAFTTRRRRSLLERRAVAPITAITNPVVCLQAGEAVFFEISPTVNGSYHYPVYVKDHLLNTNPDFDFGPFVQLSSLIEATVDITTFVHVFQTPGSYAFADSLTAGSVLLVVVVESGSTCERDGQDFRVNSLSTTTLNQFGFNRVPTINQEPDIGAIWGILAATLVLVAFVVVLMFIWLPHSAGIKIPASLQPVYRRVDRITNVVPVCNSIGIFEEQSSVCRDKRLLENFDVRTLYDKLEDQNIHVSSQLSRQQTDLQQFYGQMVQQVEGLKSLISEAQVMSTVEKSKPLSDSTGREFQKQKGSLGDERESMLVDLLRKLLTKASHKGNARFKHSVRQNAQLQAQDIDTIVHKVEQSHIDSVAECAVSLYKKLSSTSSDELVLSMLDDHEVNMDRLEATLARDKRQQSEDLLALRKKKNIQGEQSTDVVQQTSLELFTSVAQSFSEQSEIIEESENTVTDGMQALVRSTLASLTEKGNLDQQTVDGLITEYKESRESRNHWKRQMALLKNSMESRRNDRRQKLHLKHQAQRAKVEAELNLAVQNGQLREETRQQKLQELKSQHELEEKAVTGQMSMQIAVTMATLSQQIAKESAEKEIACGLECIKKGGVSSGKSAEDVEKMCAEFTTKANDLKSSAAVPMEAQGPTVAPQVQEEDSSLEEKVLIEHQERVREELKAKQDTELQNWSASQEKQDTLVEKELVEKLEMEKQKALNERKQKIKIKLQESQEEQGEQLLLAHKAELESLGKQLDSERDRQVLALRGKLSARRDQKLLEQKRRQELQLQKELLEQKKELAMVKCQEMKDTENKVIQEMRENKEDSTEVGIQKVLERRQKYELDQLTSEQEMEKQHLISEAMLECQSKYEAYRDELLTKHQEQLAAVNDEMKREQVMEVQKKELAELEEQFHQKSEEVKKSVLASVEEKHGKARLQLKEKHYEEYLLALNELLPKSADLEGVKGELEANRIKREAELQTERDSFEQAETLLVKDTLKDYELQLEEEEKTEQSKLQQSMAALQEERDRIITQRKEDFKKRVLDVTGDTTDQQKLLQSHNEDTQKLINKIDAQRLRMQADLQERISKRRENKVKEATEMRHDAVSGVTSQSIAVHTQRGPSSELKDIEENQHNPQNQQMHMDTQHSEEIKQDELTPTMREHASISPLPVSQQELLQLVVASPVYGRLQKLKVMLLQGEYSVDGYIDARDALWTGDEELHTVDISVLAPRFSVVYNFGCCVLKVLQDTCRHPPVKLLIADRIPPNHQFQRNVFRNSFAFDPSNMILYIRVQRLENVGELLLVLIHAMAHVKVGLFENDSDQRFIKELYQAIVALFNYMFLSSNATQNTLEGFDIDLKEKFVHNKVLQRLQSYAQFQIGSKLRHFLEQEAC